MTTVRCPQCGRGFQAQAEHHGRRARCRGCGGSFVVDCGLEPAAAPVRPSPSLEPSPEPSPPIVVIAPLASMPSVPPELEAQLREVEGRLERTQQEVSVALDELRIARGEVDAARAEARRAQAEAARAHAETAQARAEATEIQAESAEARALANQARAAAQSAGAQAVASRSEAAAARAEAEASRAQVDSARKQAEAARAQADSARKDAEAARAQAESAGQQADAARAEAERSARQISESDARLREQAGPLASARQRLALLEEQVRLELLAATDMESRAGAARRSLADAELSLAQERDMLAAVECERQEVAQIRATLAAQCERLRAEEAALRQSLADLEAHAGRLSGELVAAEPRPAPAGGDLVLPHDADAVPMRIADWLGGLRGLDLGTRHGREFIERLAPLLDRHPDRRSLDEWARQGRTVFVLCNTPHEAGRLKELIDVWGEVDPDGVAAIAPAFHRTTTLISAPSRVVRARPAATGKHGRRRAVGRRGR